MPPHIALVTPLSHELAPPQGNNEFQRWQHTFDHRAPVVSAANLLLVFLLKLNRVLVPALVRWMRARRQAWIKRADVDVARELFNHPNRRELCAGACCRDTYGSFCIDQKPAEMNDRTGAHNDKVSHYDDDSNDGNENQLSESDRKDGSGTGSRGYSASGMMVNMMQRWVSAFEADDTDSDDSDADGSRRHAVYRERLEKRTAARTVNPEEDIYYRIRAMQEERHREMFIGQLNYSEVMAMYVTLWSLIFYSAVIIAVVLTNFEFTIREALFFSVALVTTGVTSEIDTLIMFQRRIKAGSKHMLPEMPGYYALHSLAERTRLMASNIMEGAERTAERLKRREKKKKRAKARRVPEVLPPNKTVGDEGAVGESAV